MTNAVTVRHASKNHVVITPAEGYSVVLFNLAEGNVEVVVVAEDGSETIRLLVAGPGPDQSMGIDTDPKTGVVNIVYRDTV